MENSQSKPKRALVCAGGTGGHLFPAHALASELTRRGYDVHLVSDERTERFAKDFPCVERHSIKSATLSGRNPIQLLKAFYSLMSGYLSARRLMGKIQPDVVIGFGGYPTVPPMLAASTKGYPTMIHEANAVLGRANKFLSDKVRAVALGLPLTGKVPWRFFYTGNPVRDDALVAAQKTYTPSNEGETFCLTVFGGSQGAQVFSSVVLKAIGQLPEHLRKRLKVVQQARPEDQPVVEAAYELMEIPAEVAPFFENMVGHIGDSHLVICRSGASTTAELAVIGRPAILVPYPHALDHDQAANAAALVENGGGWVKKQDGFTADWLAGELLRMMEDPSLLETAARNAKEQGRADAAQRLANAADALANRQELTQELVDQTSEI
ncbi:MAG: undecaprenyldiphospho-muramoylpentapeptide beta-N-acetylglucosaminyltransferase [Hyphomicrobiales bacterium]